MIDRLEELKTLANELAEYSNGSILIFEGKVFKDEEKHKMATLHIKLMKRVGYLGALVSELSGIKTIQVAGRELDMWQVALKAPFDRLADSAIVECVNATNRAFGKLLDDIRRSIRDKEGNLLETKKPLINAEKPNHIKFPEPGLKYKTPGFVNEPTDLSETPIQIFDLMQFHPKVVETSRDLFKDRHYRDAIYRAFVALNNLVKEKSGLSPKELRGKKESKLMAKVFDVDNPIIKLNELITDSDISEQEGFKFLFMGATIGIRNPKGHENIIQNDPCKTLEFLGFASLLMKTIDFWEAGTTE